MRIGIGLPAAIPGSPGTGIGDWAAAAEQLGFTSLSVIDRLVYDNLDPLVALAAAAARTHRIELLTSVLNVPPRGNAIVLAKQLASIDQMSGGRLTAGLGLGGWPADYTASGIPHRGLGQAMDDMVATMKRAWAGEVAGASGPMPALPPGRPNLLFGGFAPASYARAAAQGQGWVAPSFGLGPLVDGIAATRAAWAAAGRTDTPRVVVERYFCFGAHAADVADHYLMHYYGGEYFAAVRTDTPTTTDELAAELGRLFDTGVDDVVLLPCSDGIDQVEAAAAALAEIGVGRESQLAVV